MCGSQNGGLKYHLLVDEPSKTGSVNKLTLKTRESRGLDCRCLTALLKRMGGRIEVSSHGARQLFCQRDLLPSYSIGSIKRKRTGEQRK
jgi:hypothetical protein